jgi:deoxyadenosine/deoxycytidine kinase
LNTSNENLQNNIRKRGRIYEKTITENYLEAINRQYKEGFNELKKIKKLSIDITRYHNKLEEESIKKIIQFIDRDIDL